MDRSRWVQVPGTFTDMGEEWEFGWVDRSLSIDLDVVAYSDLHGHESTPVVSSMNLVLNLGSTAIGITLEFCQVEVTSLLL